MVALKRRELTKADEIRGKFEWNQDKCGERSFSDASVRNNQMPFFGMQFGGPCQMAPNHAGAVTCKSPSCKFILK